MLELVPSPKAQLHATMVLLPLGSVLRSVKTQLSLVQALPKNAEGAALAGAVTVTVRVVVPVAPPLSVTVRRTVYVPAAT